MAQHTRALPRRNFLVTLAAGGAAAATAGIVSSRSAAKPSPSGGDKRATRGYRASEHINNYYRSATL